MINHSMGNSISYTNACTACFLYHLIDLKERDCSLSTCRMMIDGYDLATIIADSFLISAARKEKKVLLKLNKPQSIETEPLANALKVLFGR